MCSLADPIRLCVQNYGEHGRELITVEVALRLLQVLADPSAELERADRPGGSGKARLKALLHNTIFKVCNAFQGSFDTQPKCSFEARHILQKLMDKLGRC